MSNPSRPPFHVNDKVVHQKFGKGEVTWVNTHPSSNADGDENWLMKVTFENSGEKKLASSHLKMESEVHQIDEIRRVVHEFGKSEVTNTEFLMKVAKDIVRELTKYMHRERTLVSATPPDGEWEFGVNYNDDIFGSDNARIWTLGNLRFGLAVQVDNMEDDGWLQFRLVTSLNRVGDTVHIKFGELAEFELPVDYENDLNELCEKMKSAMIRMFTDQMDLVRHGFLHPDSQFGFKLSAKKK